MLETIDTPIEGLKLLRPPRHEDSLGHIVDVFSEGALEALGLSNTFVTEKKVFGARIGTIRGLHFQIAPFEQEKLVSASRGRIYDVAVDLRPGSTTYGQHFGVVLDAREGLQLYIPKGFAHGFCTLENGSEMQYWLSQYTRPEYARGLLWNDPTLAIRWPLRGATPTLAERDAKHPQFAQWATSRQAAREMLDSPQSDERLIEALEAERCRALLECDIETLTQLCSDRLLYTHTSTRQDSKASYIERVKSGFYRYLKFTPEHAQVTVVGMTAFVSMKLVSDVIVNGVAKTLTNQVLSVWAREQGQWRFVAYQPTPIPATAPT